MRARAGHWRGDQRGRRMRVRAGRAPIFRATPPDRVRPRADLTECDCEYQLTPKPARRPGASRQTEPGLRSSLCQRGCNHYAFTHGRRRSSFTVFYRYRGHDRDSGRGRRVRHHQGTSGRPARTRENEHHGRRGARGGRRRPVHRAGAGPVRQGRPARDDQDRDHLGHGDPGHEGRLGGRRVRPVHLLHPRGRQGPGPDAHPRRGLLARHARARDHGRAALEDQLRRRPEGRHDRGQRAG